MGESYCVFAAESISEKGLEMLGRGGAIEVIRASDVKTDAERAAVIARMDGLLVRSATKVTADYLAGAPRLKAVGRAGVGVDNVDVEAATARGILVMNTPGGNTISTAEHALSLMFALARNIGQADASMRAGKWDRKHFEGVELYGKTLGIIGMGRIGGEVARRAIALGMRVRVYDPFLSLSRARTLQVEIAEKLDDLLPDADFITLHSPLTDETRGILNRATLAKCKKGVRIINCARGGLVSEADLAEALKSGHVAGAALDVYEKEPPPADWPLRGMPNVVLTPHLGASTHEAQESVGVEVCEQMVDYLVHGVVRNSVNLPSVDATTMVILRPYLELGQKLGRLLAQVGPKRAEHLTVRYYGPITEHSTAPVTRAILQGFLKDAAGGEVNQINVIRFAQTLGLEFRETKIREHCDFSELVEVVATSGEEEVSVAGTFFASHPRLVRFNGLSIEANTEGVLFFVENRDRPGIVGWIGTILGRHNVNIANMSLCRAERGGTALTVLQLDSAPPEGALEEIRQESDVVSVRMAHLG